MRPPKKITATWLRKHTARQAQVDIFAAEWPDGAEISAANIRRAADLGLNLAWLAPALVPTPAGWACLETIAIARRTLEEAIAPEARAFREAVFSAERTLQKVAATALIAALGLEEAATIAPTE